ncbi:MAG: hypothetical protein HC860_08800 [Alkalinema sp. RU_4_3]|nr:hypothetical protein [Alkalinema sp. RU_4_3]
MSDEKRQKDITARRVIYPQSNSYRVVHSDATFSGLTPSDGTDLEYLNLEYNLEYLSEQLKTVENLQQLPQGWDGLNAETPNKTSVDAAKSVLMSLFQMELIPDHITASVENGVGISFVRGEKYADIECFNSGEILAVISDRHSSPTVWEITNIPQDITLSLSKISDSLRLPRCSAHRLRQITVDSAR